MDHGVERDLPPGAPAAESNPEDRVTKILQWWKEARTHWDEWRKEAERAYDMVAGRQFTDAEIDSLKEQKRPPVVFNRIAPVLDSICGSEAQNRQQFRYFPRGVEDSGVNELYSNAAKWVRDRCNADIEENEALRDALVCGFGATEWRMNYDTNPDGECDKERIDPFEVLPDPSARKRNFIDGKRVMRERWVPCADVHAQWPDKEMELVGTHQGEDKATSQPINTTDVAYSDDVSTHYRAEKVEYRLIECQWAEYQAYFRVLDPNTGKLVDMPTADYLRVRERMAALGMPAQAVQAKKWTWKRSIICGRVELQYGDAPSKSRPSINFITGLRDRNRRLFYGLVRAMIDPQTWANKFLSQTMHIINANAKGGVMYETGTFANPLKAKKEWAQPDAMIQVESGALSGGKIQPRAPITYPAGLDNLMSFAISAIRDVTGVNLEMLGLADRQQAGVLEEQRKRAALTILATWFDALHAYRRQDGYLLLDFIRNYISDGRLIRIDSDGKEQYLPLVRLDETVEYDVIVDTAPTSVNLKRETFEAMQALLPNFAKLGIRPPSDLVKYLPLPESLAQKWAAEIAAGGVPPQVQQQMQGMQEQMQKMGQALQQAQVVAAQAQQKEQVDKVHADIASAQHQMELDKKDLEIAKRDIKAMQEKLRADAAAMQCEQMQGQQQMMQMRADESMQMQQQMPMMIDQRIGEILQTVLGQFRQQIAADVEAIVNAPKEFEYGADGLVTSMNGRRVVRDEQNRLVGLQ